MAFSFTMAAAAALLPFVSGQTFSACNPMEKTTCPPNPAIETNLECDFKNGETALNGWKVTAGSLRYAGDGAQFTINKQGDAPTIQTNGYFLFGRAEVKTKAASGQGIISSIVLQSESLDEVDWEFIGGVNTEVQSNYFGKGNTSSYDRMLRHPVTTPQQVAHTYIVDWTKDRINFYIDDAATPVRTLNYADANGGKNFPQTPMNLRVGIWAGGDPTNGKGTIEWAGGETDYTKVPFTQVLEYVKVTNYSPGKEYKWTDQTGSYQSIEVVGGEPETGSPAKPVESPSGARSSIVSQSAVPSAGSPGSPGGLGGGNGGNNVGSNAPGEFFPTPTGGVAEPTGVADNTAVPQPPGADSESTSCTTTVTVTVIGDVESTVLPTEIPATTIPSEAQTPGIPSSVLVDTEIPTSVPVVPTAPIIIPSSAITPSTATPPPFTGAAAAPTALGGFALAVAGIVGALFM